MEENRHSKTDRDPRGNKQKKKKNGGKNGCLPERQRPNERPWEIAGEQKDGRNGQILRNRDLASHSVRNRERLQTARGPLGTEKARE